MKLWRVVFVFFLVLLSACTDAKKDFANNMKVSVGRLDVVEVPSEYKKFLRINTNFENLGSKEIVAVTGILDFYNVYGEKVYGIKIDHRDPIPAKSKTSSDFEFNLNQFIDSHNELADMAERHAYKSEFRPEGLVFADGSKIIVENRR